MPKQVTCPECRARFTLADEMAGKKIRCSKCQAIFDPKAQRGTEDEEITTSPRSPARSKAAPAPAARKGDSSASRHRDEDRDDDDRATRRKKDDDDRAARRKKDDDDRPARRIKKPAGSALTIFWLVGMLFGMLLLVGCVIGGLMWMANRAADPEPFIANNPPPPLPFGRDNADGPGVDGAAPHEVPKEPFPPAGFPPTDTAPSEDNNLPVDNPPPPAPAKVEKDPPPSKGGDLSPEVVDAVKRSTVYIEVRKGPGGGSGSGFFGCPDAPNIVLTNAHVVDMLSPDSRLPDKVEVRIHSGEKGERMLPAKVLGVDRASDLAVLDVGTTTGLPKPLTVSLAAKLRQLDKVYVFGFPLGNLLGKEMTVNESKVSAMRRREGVLARVQIDGAMDHGNSGGPVVDQQGHVIGVLVAGILSTKLCFAIPGERVSTLLYGRISGMGIGHAFKSGTEITAPVKIDMIDPRGQIKQVGMDVWVGSPPSAWVRSRPASSTAPVAQAGDSERKRFIMPVYRGGIARGRITLPPLPAGKVYWVQPMWLRSAGENAWGSASVYQPGEPLERKEVALQTRFAVGEPRRVLLSSANRLRIGDNDDSEEVAAISIQAGFSESVSSATDANAALTLAYQGAARKAIVNTKNMPDETLDFVRTNLGLMKAQLELDGAGSIQSNRFTLGKRLPGSENLKTFHDSVKSALDAVFLPLANKTVKPNDTWKTQRTLGAETPGPTQTVHIDLTCRYLGVRTKAGREEAVVTFQGRGRAGSTGKAHGRMIVDVATGIIRSVELHAAMEVEVMAKGDGASLQTIKVRSAMVVRMERDL